MLLIVDPRTDFVDGSCLSPVQSGHYSPGGICAYPKATDMPLWL